jgi:hypothetical protein
MSCKEILSSNGYKIQVSEEDFPHLNQFGWNAHVVDGTVRGISRGFRQGSKTIFVQLSHEILTHRGIEFDGTIDHKDRNVLNNQFENLRPASRNQQSWNHGLRKDNKTGFVGVKSPNAWGSYVVTIEHFGINLYIGSFKDPIEAAKAYDKVALRLRGDFAFLNFSGV